MQKITLVSLLIGLLLTGISGTPNAAAGVSEQNFQVIPDEAIRLRILANSNAKMDQDVKRTIRDKVNAEITQWVEELTSIEAARELIQDRIDEVDAIVADTLASEGAGNTYQVDYDDAVSFPTKLYGSFIYPAGDYEAILITLGEGKGDNWWCVLFPPLCFLDFSNGATVDEAASEQTVEAEEKDEDVEVEFFLVRIWNNIFG
ncbi:stage II sporulation protein R [Thalassobacillus sp. CUG 92003]|uniref:stage II sporulation protein R n=1 Tax=Thalassobacillus sp. CUG 92003 TaxID=2736641 RepID=UPI0015E636A0|nr:stage II sporulation protein R [Thalassobacillus sp. CUG 92003]